MASRLLTFVVWALVAASGLFWGLKLFTHARGLPDNAQATRQVVSQGGDLSRLLGTVVVAAAEEEPEDASDRFKLLGVVAPAGHTGPGVALIAVGDQPARAWRTGAVVDGDTVLLSVGKRSAQLGPKGGPVSAELSLPEPAVAAASPARPILSIGAGGVHGGPQGQPPQQRPMTAQPAPQPAQNNDDDE